MIPPEEFAGARGLPIVVVVGWGEPVEGRPVLMCSATVCWMEWTSVPRTDPAELFVPDDGHPSVLCSWLGWHAGYMPDDRLLVLDTNDGATLWLTDSEQAH